MSLSAAALVGFATLLLALAQAAKADALEDFYKGRQIRLIIALDAGDDYDLWARAIGRHIGRHIPGRPTLVAENMPGGGQIVGTNYLYTVAAKDGSAIGMVGRNVAEQALMRLAPVRFDPTKFNWLGSPEKPSRICFARRDAAVQQAADLLDRQLIVGGPGTTGTSIPMLLRNLLGLRFKLIEGYNGVSGVELAMERGEVEGSCFTAEALERSRPAWLAQGTVRILFNIEREPVARFDAPSVYRLVKTDEQGRILDFISSAIELGRPMAAPPGVPTERVAALRRAFDETMRDADFLAETKKLGMSVDARSGVELAAIVDRFMQTPPDLAAKAEALGHP